MPISFEQPAPFNADMAAKYGAFQARQAGLGSGANAQAAMNARAQGDAADRQLQAMMGGEQLAGSMSQQNADRDAQMENAGRQRSFELQQNEQLNQQRQAQMQLQSSLQQTELTQTEQLRYNRMKQAVGAVNADDTFQPDEKQALITQLHTGIIPLETRLAATKVKQEEMQTAQLLQHSQKMAAMEAATGATRAALVEKQLYKIPNPNSPVGYDAYTVDPRTGQLHQVVMTAPAKAAAGSGKKNEDLIDEKPAEMHARAKLFADREVEFGGDKSQDGPTKARWNEKYAANLKQQEDINRAKQVAAAQSSQQSAVGAQVSKPATPPQVAREQPPEPEMKPFNLDDFKSMNPKQLEFRNQYMNQLMAIQARKDLPVQVRQKYEAAVNQIANIVAAAGSKDNLTLAQRDERDRLIRYIATMPDVDAATAKAQGDKTRGFDDSAQMDLRKAYAEQNK